MSQGAKRASTLPAKSKPRVGSSSENNAHKKWNTFDIPLEKFMKKKLSGAQRRKKARLDALSKGLPILTPGEIQKNLNAYGAQYTADFEEFRLHKAKAMRDELATSSEGNPYKWVSPTYKTKTSLLKPEATVTSKMSQMLQHRYENSENYSDNSGQWRSSFNANVQKPRSEERGADYRNVISSLKNPKNKEQYTTTGKEPVRMTKMGVAHSNHPSTKLSDHQCELIQSDLLYEILKCQKGKGPQFKNISLNDHVVWLTVANESSKNWLYENIPHFKPWKNASLKVGRPFEINGLVRVAAYIPQSMNDMESGKILQLLKSQNKGLKTEKWTILKTLPDTSGRTFFMEIDSESLKVIQELSFRPFLGLSRITFKIRQ